MAHTQVYTCPRCNGVHSFEILRIITWFTLFWIPLVPYSFKYFMRCPVCGEAASITKEQAKAYNAPPAAGG